MTRQRISPHSGRDAREPDPFDSVELTTLRYKWEKYAEETIEMRVMEDVYYPVLLVLVSRKGQEERYDPVTGLWRCLRYFPRGAWSVSIDSDGIDLIEAVRWMAETGSKCTAP